MKLRIASALATVLTFIAALSWTSEAFAGPNVGLGVDLALPVGKTTERAGMGWGISARGGYELPVPFVQLGLEAGAGYTYLPAEPPDVGNANIHVTQIFAGPRVGIDVAGFNPSLFADFGYGWMRGKGTDYTLDFEGWTMILGAAFDYTALPLFDLGLHAAYVQQHHDDGSKDVYDWVDVGIHASVGF